MRDAALVFAGGDRPRSQRGGRPGPAALVIAADSGLDHASRSASASTSSSATSTRSTPTRPAPPPPTGHRVERHPTAKDATDLELALLPAVDARCTPGHRGRRRRRPARPLPRQRAAARPRRARRTSTSTRVVGTARITVVRDHAELHGAPGDLLLAAAGRRARPRRAHRRPAVSRFATRTSRPARPAACATSSSHRRASVSLARRRAARRAPRRSVDQTNSAPTPPEDLMPVTPPARIVALVVAALLVGVATAPSARHRRRHADGDDGHARHPRLVRGVEVGARRVHRSRPASR